jgi:hypothetical protein
MKPDAVSIPDRLQMRRIKAGLYLALLTVLLAGCDDAFIDPFDNEDRFYTVFGYLDVLETTHAVRVVPITRQSAVIRDPSAPNAAIDAIVTSTELSTGQTVHWTHSLERLEDGTWGHIFRASFRVQAGRTYRLDIVRSDGVTASAETTMPSLSAPALIERDPVQFNADSSFASQRLRNPGVASPWKMEAIYLWGGGDINHRIYVPYERAGDRSESGDWELELNISEDQAVVRASIQDLVDSGRIAPTVLGTLTAMGLRLRVLDEGGVQHYGM